MTVKEIVVEYLKKNGYDGLYHKDECGCLIDDFLPCGGDSMSDCSPGYKVKCDCGEECRFYVSPEKENNNV